MMRLSVRDAGDALEQLGVDLTLQALARQGVTVAGPEVARVVGAAVGKEIEWAG